MTDIRLDLSWDIDPGGDIEFSVSPSGSDQPLASFILSEDEIAGSLADDLEEFDLTGDEAILEDWIKLSVRLGYYSQAISKLIEDARYNGLIRAHQFDGEDDEG